MLSLARFAYAQSDTISIETIVVKAPRLEQAGQGEWVKSWSKTDLQEQRTTKLGELLDREGGVFIKSYGIGSLATSSLRGGSAGHTALTWNGLPINSPMLGLLDFSLVPVFFTDRVDLQYGGGSASWGSGAISGTIALRNAAPPSGWSTELGATIASFGRQDQQATISYHQGRIGIRTRYFRETADNDFPFRIRDDLPKQRLQNARSRQSGNLTELYWQIAPRHRLNIHGWWQHVYREIPPTTTQTRSEARQEDEVLRLAAHWQYQADRWIWQYRAAWFAENILYSDPRQLLEAPSDFRTIIQEVESKHQFGGQWSFSGGAQFQHTSATATGYPNGRQEDRMAVFASISWQASSQFFARVAARQEWIGEQWASPTPSLSINWKSNAWLSWKAKLSRNYRYPTLNDRFWQPGGNPDLKPEAGWSQELTGSIQKASINGSWQLSLTGFNRQIDNWILWSQLPGQVFWSSNNIALVWSRGLSPRFEWGKHFGPLSLQSGAGYDLTRSTSQKTVLQPNFEKGEQLWYVPVHRLWGWLQCKGHNWQLRYQHQYTGRSEGVLDELDGYSLGHVNMSYSFLKTTWQIRLFGRIDNIWNTTYRVIERRPMPGRSYQLGLQFNLSSTKNPTTE